jgi:hypothetical protein
MEWLNRGDIERERAEIWMHKTAIAVCLSVVPPSSQQLP